MPTYRFIGLTPRFYPDERGADGRSLMAEPGDSFDWDRTPEDGLWALADDNPPEPPADPPADPEPAPVPDPEPAPVTPEPEPEPVAAPPAPEPAPAPVEPDEPIPPFPAPEPDPAPVTDPEPPQAVRDWFASMGQTPPARA